MKTKLLVLLVLNFSFSLAMAQVGPQDLTPLNDGLNTEISQETTQEMSRWASSAKTMLEDLKQRAQGLPTSTQVALFEQGIDQVVLSSGNSSAQLLMRFSLNRAMYVANLVQVEAGNERGVADFKLNLYRHAIELALRYYESDLAYLQDSDNESVRQPYAVFGVEFANILLRLNRNIIDLSAQYGVFVKAFEFLRSDLQADLDAQEYAADFMRLNNALSTSGTANTDVLMRGSLRDLRRVVETLSVHDGHGFLFVTGVESSSAADAAGVARPVQVSAPTRESCFSFERRKKKITGYTCQYVDIVIPSTIGGVKVRSIGKSSFFRKNLTSVVIPDSVTKIGEDAFNSNSLTSIVIPGSVTNISLGAFAQNDLLSVVFSDGLIRIGRYAFYSNRLTSVIIPSTVTNIDESAFSNNSQLATAVVPARTLNADETLINAEAASATPSNPTKPGQTTIPTSESCFNFVADQHTIVEYRCTDRDVVIPRTIAGVVVKSIGYQSFNNRSLNSVVIPESVVSIADNAFADNRLTSIVIPSSVIAIGESAFARNNLTSINISHTTRMIGEWAFSENELTSVQLDFRTTSYSRNAFDSNVQINRNY